MNIFYRNKGLIMGVSQVDKEANHFGVHIVDMAHLKGHEELDKQLLINLTSDIKLDGILKKSITVDINTNVVLDGHHRIGALRLLGYYKIPVLFIDYRSPKIGVKTAKQGEEYPKLKVLEAALKNKPLPPKSTWHHIMFFEKIAHISKIEKRVDVPLDYLR